MLCRRNRPRASRYSSPPRRAALDLRGPAGHALELEQPVEHVDRRVERGPHRPVLDLAVPAAVLQPLAEGSLDDRCDVHPEVRPGLDRPAVDARLDLAVEVVLRGVLPAPVLGDECDRLPGGLRTRVEPEELQGLQRVHRGRPGLPMFTAGEGRREAGASRPEPVGILQREEARAPAVVLDPVTLGRDVVGRRVREIAHHLPADGRVAVEQPVDRAHRRTEYARPTASIFRLVLAPPEMTGQGQRGPVSVPPTLARWSPGGRTTFISAVSSVHIACLRSGHEHSVGSERTTTERHERGGPRAGSRRPGQAMGAGVRGGGTCAPTPDIRPLVLVTDDDLC